VFANKFPEVSMPLRSIPIVRNEQIVPMPEEEAPERRNFWRTALLLATSAALGGIAVAILNRRALAQMRQQGED
jgi:hypothetical protein